MCCHFVSGKKSSSSKFWCHVPSPSHPPPPKATNAPLHLYVRCPSHAPDHWAAKTTGCRHLCIDQTGPPRQMPRRRLVAVIVQLFITDLLWFGQEPTPCMLLLIVALCCSFKARFRPGSKLESRILSLYGNPVGTNKALECCLWPCVSVWIVPGKHDSLAKLAGKWSKNATKTWFKRRHFSHSF